MNTNLYRSNIQLGAPPTFSSILGANYFDDWDFDNAASLSLTGTAIDSITSTGSNAGVFTAAGTARPTLVSNDINGKDVASFDAATDVMTIAASTATYKFLHYGQGCVILVMKVNNDSSTRTILATANTSTQRGVRFNKSTGENISHNVFNGASDLTYLHATSVGAVWCSQVSVNDTENATVAERLFGTQNNILTTSNAVDANGSNTNAASNLTLGARTNLTAFFSGRIARVIIANTRPTTNQLALIQKRLEYEYGIFPI
jgi:hypothetical protein